MTCIYGLPHIKLYPIVEPYDKKSSLNQSRQIICNELKKVLNLDFAPTISHNSNGKPSIKELPQVNISISHTDGAISFILDKENNVGIDIEIISKRATKILNRITKTSERELISDKNTHFYSALFFSAKETAYKLFSKPNTTIADFIIVGLDLINQNISISFLDKLIQVNYKKLDKYILTWSMFL